MEGSATLTMDTSRTTMNCATQAMDRITQSGTRRPLGMLSVPVPVPAWVSVPVPVPVPAVDPASNASDIGKSVPH